MALLVWFTMGIALWHFTVFLPDRFWQGIVGAFLGSVIGAVVFGAIVAGDQRRRPRRHRPRRPRSLRSRASHRPGRRLRDRRPRRSAQQSWPKVRADAPAVPRAGAGFPSAGAS